MSWNQACNKWEAYVHETSPSKRKTNLGLFVDEHQAAQAVDERREALVKHQATYLALFALAC